jgi:CheY-like chemotaxis protein
VVSNLLNNAAKFTPAGGRIELAASVSSPRDGTSELLLQVTDTGIGIESHMLGRIFDMFTQAEPGRERSQGGLGIGLALARQLVQMHGGTLRARSAGRGHGSTFELRLPLLEETARVAGPAVSSPRVAMQRRVLVVDDNADAAESLAMLIRQWGGIAWAANDGPTAIARAQEFSPEVVLLDLGMPGMDGYETCRRLRELGTKACIVALTGWGHDSDKHRVLRSGFDAHLTKPADPVELEQLLVAGRAPASVAGHRMAE